jgi:hypothetical protein
VVIAHFTFGGMVRPLLFVGFLHFAAFAFDLAVFVIALTYTPYVNGCSTSSYKGCEMERAAIAIDGVLWYVLIAPLEMEC